MKDVTNKKLKYTPEDRRLGEEVQSLQTKKKLRLCNAIYAVLNSKNIQDGPTRRDRNKGIRAYLQAKNVGRHAAAEKRKFIDTLQMPLFFK